MISVSYELLKDDKIMKPIMNEAKDDDEDCEDDSVSFPLNDEAFIMLTECFLWLEHQAETTPP